MPSDASSSDRLLRRPYGEDLAANYGLAGAPYMITRVLQRAEFAVTELQSDDPPARISDAIIPQDAYLICCQLRDRGPFEYWEEGRTLGACTLRNGETTIRDLRRDPRAMTNGPLHSVIWFVPRASLSALADEAGASCADELRIDPCAGVADETIHHLSRSLLPALKAPAQVNRLFLDHVSFALAAHLTHAYEGLQARWPPARGGLALWQERRAKEMLVADLGGSTPLAEVARACGLSTGHFARAFRKSTGLAPHAWLLRARVDRAMTLLRRAEPSLSEIALACGFADQSHFGRVFLRQTGQSPRAWRRRSIR